MVAALAALSMVAALAGPAVAAETAAVSAKPSPRLNLAAATSSPLVTAPDPRAFAQDAPTPAVADSPRSFFRTRTGMAAIALMAVGVAYVAVSIPNDNEKVHSPIR